MLKHGMQIKSLCACFVVPTVKCKCVTLILFIGYFGAGFVFAGSSVNICCRF